MTHTAPSARLRAHRLAGSALVSACLVAIVTAGSAQEQLPGSDLRLDFSTGLLVSDNLEGLREPEGTSTLSETTLGLSFDSITRRQTLSVDAGARLQFGRYADQIQQRELEQSAVQSPFISANYSRETRANRFALSARYQERDNGLEEIDLVDAESLIVDQGTRSDMRLGATLQLGRTAPLSFTGNVEYSERRFFDTTDPDLTDQDFYRLRTEFGLRLTPTARLTFETAYFERDEYDPEDTLEVNRLARLGFGMDIRPGLTASASAGYQLDETTRTVNGRRVTDTQEEPVLSFSLRQARQDGAITLSGSQRVTEAGSRTSLTVGRSLDLPRAELSASLGVSVNDDYGVNGIGSLTYRQPLPRGRFEVSFNQRVATDDDDDTLFTSTSFSYTHTISRLSSIGLSVDLAATQSLEDDGTDRQRARASVTWSRSVTEDWRFNAGYRHSTARETDEDPIIENSVFANLSRSFDLRP